MTCFFERDPGIALKRRATVEGVGTFLLMLAANGSGLTGERLFPGQPALGLLAIAVATAGALVSLIISLGSVSGGHYNPLITGLQWLAGERRLDCTLAYVAAQLGGGVMGAELARLIFGTGGPLPTAAPASWNLILSEVAASAALMIVVFGCARSRLTKTGPFAVGAWLVGAILATPSTSYANPAITLGALFAAGPIALSTTTVVRYIPAEIAGALLALLFVTVAFPDTRRSDRTAAVPAIASTKHLP